MWQEIIVALIGIAVVGYVGYKIYHAFTRPKSKGCGCGCSECPTRKRHTQRG